MFLAKWFLSVGLENLTRVVVCFSQSVEWTKNARADKIVVEVMFSCILLISNHMSECTFVGLWKITRAYLFQIALKIMWPIQNVTIDEKCNINAKCNNFLTRNVTNFWRKINNIFLTRNLTSKVLQSWNNWETWIWALLIKCKLSGSYKNSLLYVQGLIFHCHNFLRREPETDLYCVMVSLTRVQKLHWKEKTRFSMQRHWFMVLQSQKRYQHLMECLIH